MRNESPATTGAAMSQEGWMQPMGHPGGAGEKTIGATWSTPCKNCVLALTHDLCWADTSAGTCSNDRLTIDCPLPWVRESSVINDNGPGLSPAASGRGTTGSRRSAACRGALKIAATDNAFHPVRDRLRACAGTACPGCGTPCIISSARR